MALRVFSNSIERLLRMKGISRLEVKDDITEAILNNPIPYPELRFLESKVCSTDSGEWNEYYILLEFGTDETPEHLKYMMLRFSQYMTFLYSLGVEKCGIQEMDCTRGSYNILIYVINNGKDKEKCDKDLWEFEF